jgi:hypothetical protein
VNLIWGKRRKSITTDIELPSERAQKTPDVLGAARKAGEGFKELKKRGLVGARSPSKR